eukprot:TRINITY_DN31783_c0_g1_i1.p1 TRINITY_DN31783_c0_g1~~TRINITY_DN31783_c0_g1_i1.p1  ORF type:complete len:158 (+),score=27.96 TRINITY_DN31783_c0_g1_i1:65-475(+)
MVADILITYSQSMQNRRQELLEHIRKRSAGDPMGSPRRIALQEINLNFGSQQAGKKASDTPIQQQGVTQVDTTPVNLPYGEYSPTNNKAAEQQEQWWDGARLQEQLQQQSSVSPSAIFEPRNSPINTTEIFRVLKK